MANPPPPQPDGIVDDFFDQIFAYGGGGATPGSSVVGTGVGDAGLLGGGDATGGFPGIADPLASADGCVAAGGGGSGASLVGDCRGGFPGNTGVFPLGLSLEGGGGGYRKLDDGSSSGGKRFREDALEPNKPPGETPFHAQLTPGPVAAVPHPPAPRPRVRARRGQATDPHSIAERLRRERIAERIRALQELVPNTNKTDRAVMLDEIVDYVKFLRLQVKVLSMSRLGGAGAVAQLVADIPLQSVEGVSAEGGNRQIWEKWSADGTEQQVAKLMEEDVGAAMQYLQSKALCIMPISLAATIYHTPHHQETPSFVKPEPNAPS